MLPPARRGRSPLLSLIGVALLCVSPAAARAGVLTRASLGRYFPDPFLVGEREKDLPVWPIFRQSGPPSFTTDLVGYAFESIDLAPVPGFSGTPLNLLVALDPNGALLDVQVLSHHEPVFLGGVGQEPLVRFLSQYKGLSLKQNIKIGSGAGRASQGGSTNVYIDGVAKATASVRIVNQSILSAALRVARAKLGFSGAGDPDLVAHVREELFEPRSWSELLEAGVVQHLSLRNRDVEQAFAGSEGAGLDPEAAARPDEAFADVYVAMATVPTAGRNLLSDAGWRTLVARVNPGDHVLLVLSKGRYSFVADDFVRNSVPDRLSLAQSGLAIEMRDLDLVDALRPIGQPAFDTAMAFRVISQAGLDPGAPMQLSLRVTRTKGIVYPERISRDFKLDVAVPARFLVPAADDQKSWTTSWKARKGEIAVLVLALGFLSWVLARQSPLVTRERSLRWFRPAFLVFTLAFIGWYAQAQLSIVNLVALLQATVAGHAWTFFLFDPLSTILWVFVLASLFVWGRGTFCGWLCPFGALQELVAKLARLARVPQVRLATRTDRRLKRLKYVALAAIVAAAIGSARWSDAAVEVEPFKTAITFLFARAWPFTAYAVALVAAGAVVFKAFCRYLCPLGAFLALAGRVRRLDWLTRRAECGKPCQTCRKSCEYQAIERDGRIDYVECFQCMDCVVIYRDDTLCTIRIVELKRKPTPAPAAGRTEH